MAGMAPGGLPMAGRAGDRDGLRLDVLHVPLGPVLADWPAGLVVELVLQGDVVQEAAVRPEATATAAATAGTGAGTGDGGDRTGSYWDEPWLRARSGEAVTVGEGERRRAAAHLDSVGRLLAVAGWEREASRARRMRDSLLGGGGGGGSGGGGGGGAGSRREFAAFARRVRRSAVLRWMLRGVGVVEAADVASYGITGPAGTPGDALARLGTWLDGIGRALGRLADERPLTGEDGPRGPVGEAPSAALLAALPALLTGAELAAARLIVASLDPDLEQLAAARV
ncbi:hypothetical protein D5H75_29100 [Bailinhaonella thermotolerans]|uniref:Uncharacterized protein n=2 Tax=Bailinhaonella thermotolerans TaxID=1070861 RepID=A0A3A4A794_9ACTN|nr:hypothetical protein D5H75_29100 [Bailinhaonella thermotolerans]